MPRRRRTVAPRELTAEDLAAIELATELEHDGEHLDVAQLIRDELPRGRFRAQDVICLRRVVLHRDRGYPNASYEAWVKSMVIERRRRAVPWRDAGAH